MAKVFTENLFELNASCDVSSEATSSISSDNADTEDSIYFR